MRKFFFIVALSLSLTELLVGNSGFFVDEAAALPFNTDMMNHQLITGTVMRPKPPGSIAVGSLQRQIPTTETSWVQKNPYDGDPSSAIRGERRFRTNCSPCHGSFKDNKHVPSAILVKGMPSIDLSSEAVVYLDPGTRQKPKPDNHFFTYVFKGGVLMPAYGYKLSNTDIWDLVSYIRHVQRSAGNLK